MKRHLAALVMLAGLLSWPGAAGAVCLPVYGNWCGADYPAPGSTPPVRDAFDLACKRHDRCYDREGAGAPACDAWFATELRALYRQYGWLPRPLQWAERYFTGLSGRGEALSDPRLAVDDLYTLFGTLAWDCGGD